MKMNDYAGEVLLFLKGALLFLVGPLNAQLAYMFVAIGIDLFFGIKVASKEKTFSWNTLAVKVGNKVMIYGAWIAMFHVLDMVIGLPSTARNGVILLLISMEIMSASKNTAKLGYGKLATLLENIYFVVSRDNPLALKKEEEDKEGASSDKGGEQK